MTAERRWSCSANRAGICGMRVPTPAGSASPSLPAVSRDDQLALWLAVQVVVRVLGQMRETAGSPARVEADITG